MNICIYVYTKIIIKYNFNTKCQKYMSKPNISHLLIF